MASFIFNHGSFILVTATRNTTNPPIQGILSPHELEDRDIHHATAVLIDQGMSETQRNALAARCLKVGTPFLWVTAPTLDGAEDSPNAWLSAFLRGHRGHSNALPSPATIDRLKLQTLIDIITTANSHLKPRDVMDSVMTQIHHLIACEAWSVLILENHHSQILKFAAASGPVQDQLVNIVVPFGEGIAGWVAKHRQPLIVNNAQNDPRFFDGIDKESNFETRNILCAPLVSRERTLGVIEMINRTGQDGFSNEDLELVQILVNPAAVAIDNAFLYQRAQRLTIQDDLTELYNSRYLNQCLDLELKRALREKTQMSLIFLDLDGFKAVNDTYGHLQGSRALVDIAAIIRRAARQTDIVGRYGGDEFMLILPATGIEGALTTAERIREAIASFVMKDIRMTASIGIATYPIHGKSKAALIRKADTAMYAVKDRGKNAILVADTLKEKL